MPNTSNPLIYLYQSMLNENISTNDVVYVNLVFFYLSILNNLKIYTELKKK